MKVPSDLIRLVKAQITHLYPHVDHSGLWASTPCSSSRLLDSLPPELQNNEFFPYCYQVLRGIIIDDEVPIAGFVVPSVDLLGYWNSSRILSEEIIRSGHLCFSVTAVYNPVLFNTLNGSVCVVYDDSDETNPFSMNKIIDVWGNLEGALKHLFTYY